MKKLVSALVAVSALAVAVPAAAQSYDRYDRSDRYDQSDRYDRDYYGGYRYDRNLGYGYETPYQRMRQRIENGVRAGTISGREAAVLRRELQEIRRLDRAYHRDGRISQWERNDIDRRIRRLQQQLRRFRINDDYRGGYDRYDRDGYYRDGRRY